MKKRGKKKHSSNTEHNGNHHPRLKEELTSGQRSADAIARFGGSWGFIFGFLLVLAFWIALNIYLLSKRGTTWDPYPFILLNLFLSCLAAIQAPVILMSQNRQAERDRIDASYDHAVNRKAEREIQFIQKDLNSIKRIMRENRKKRR